MSKVWRYTLAAIVPCVVLLVIALQAAFIISFGQEIKLVAHCVDPHDPFRGEYVALKFDIEQVSHSLLSGDLKRENIVESETGIYVALAQNDSGFWMPISVSRKVQDKQDVVWLRGDIVRITKDFVRFNFGHALERFYLPEGTGSKLELKSQLTGQLEATVRVWHGRPVIVGLK